MKLLFNDRIDCWYLWDLPGQLPGTAAAVLDHLMDCCHFPGSAASSLDRLSPSVISPVQSFCGPICSPLSPRGAPPVLCLFTSGLEPSSLCPQSSHSSKKDHCLWNKKTFNSVSAICSSISSVTGFYLGFKSILLLNLVIAPAVHIQHFMEYFSNTKYSEIGNTRLSSNLIQI